MRRRPRHDARVNTQSPLRVVRVDDPPALQARAMDNLRFIRETMERAGSFTAVSGWGMCATGALAVGAAVVAGSDQSSWRWMAAWMGALLGSVLVSGWATVRKARGAGMPILSGPGRKFVLAFSPPMFVGALLTLVLVRVEQMALLPGAWMLLYGTAVMAAGAFSVRIVPAMGGCFLLLGAVAVFSPPFLAQLLMVIGFGGLHLAFGTAIARGHGG